MDGRTYGDTTNCKGCRYWSEMVARSIGGGPLEAMCWSADGPRKGKYTQGWQSCTSWASGHHGAIDTPGEEINALYQKEDCANKTRNLTLK